MLRLAIVGAGIMGSNHARVAGQVPGLSVTHIIDADRRRGEVLAQSIGACFQPDLEALRGQVDAAVVAVPTALHLSVGLQLMESGIHVLMEKPIADRVEAAEELVTAANRSEVCLMVGHVERFNPAVMELESIVTSPIHLEATRVSAYSNRVADGVIRDLMIHDIDVAVAIMGSEPSTITALAQCVRGDSEDLAAALLGFPSGTTASLTASRIGQQKIRRIQVTQPDDFVQADLVRQDVTIHRVQHAEFLTNEGRRYSQSGVIEIPYLRHRGEPLSLELSHFVECIRDGTRPRVSGEDGLRSLRLAERVRQAAGVN
jgi:predicted dehydrogenase